jgi:hypothetical protein
MNKAYGNMMDKLLQLNPSTCTLQMSIPAISNLPFCFEVKCLYSGDNKRMVSDINDIRTVATVKIRKSDLEKVKIETNTDFGTLDAPTSDFKTLIEKVKVNNYEYIILEEKSSGFSFSDVVILVLERCN